MSEARSPSRLTVLGAVRSHPRRTAVLTVLGVIIMAAAAGGIFLATFDANSLKPRIIAAVGRATGRDLALNGNLHLTLSLQPTIEARDVAFANPPGGFSRPQMATVDRLRLQFALLPLLAGRVEIERLVLIRPNILLENAAASGQPNWRLTPQAPPSATPLQPPQTKAARRTYASINAIQIEDGTLAYRDDRTGTLRTLGLSQLQATAASPDAPLHVDTDANYNATAFNLIADTGGLTRLQDRDSTTPWPVKLTLTAAGARLSAEGSLTQPLLGQGYDVAVTGSIPDLTALAPLLPGRTLPPLHDVSFAARLADRPGAWPEVSALTLHAGAADLGAELPGLQLTQLDITAATLELPIKATLTGRFDAAPLALTATLGAPALLLPGAKPQAFPIDATAQAAGASFTAKGSVADLRAITGLNVNLTGQIPDLSALSALARRPLPPLQSIAFQGTLTDAAGGLRSGAALHNLRLTSPTTDLAGGATLGLQPRHALTATLTSSHIDLDALQAALDQTPAPPAAQPTAQPPEPARREARRSDRIFSDQPIPFDRLRGADGDIRLTVAALRSGGVDYKSIDTHAVLTNGKLAVDHLTADLPQGSLDAQLAVDASQPTPPVHLSLHASGVALKSILTLLREPSYAAGNLEIHADLDAAGTTPHTLAASLDGSLGLAMAGGTIDNRLLGSILGRAMRDLNALDLVGRGGASELRCFGLRADAQHGDATLRALALNSALLTLTGSGTVNLGAETLALTLRPEARIAGTPVVIPLQLSGPIRSPTTALNRLGAAESNVGPGAGAVLGDATPLGIIGGLFGADKLLQRGGGDMCTPALAAARGGKPPPPGQAGPIKPLEPTLSNPGTALRNLFR